LSVGKIEEGNLKVNYSHYDIHAQALDIIQEVQHLLKKEQTIDYVHDGDDSFVYLDASMVKHIVTNLLSNAIKFSNERSVINLTTSNREKKVVISVKDEGIGIPAEDRQNLFKRFFRSSNATNIQGTGLGLHIVSKYTELMNGVINCDSELGKGTRFTITFTNNNLA
jgi:signal transduction histidine kinase